MDFQLSLEQRMLIETVRGFIATELQPLEQQVEDDGFLAPATARTIFEKSRALGLYAMNIPTEFGGGGLSALDTMLVEEQFGHTSDIPVRKGGISNSAPALIAAPWKAGSPRETWTARDAGQPRNIWRHCRRYFSPSLGGSKKLEQGANRHHARWANFPRRLASAAAMLLGFGLLGLGLAGCGSSGTQNAELAAAPIPAGQARLTVTRTSSLLYAGAPASMTLNGKPLAELGVGGSTLANIAAGENIIAVSAWSYPGSFSIRLNAAAGRNYALEVAPRSESFGPATLLGPLGGVVDAALNQNAGAFQLRFVAGE